MTSGLSVRPLPFTGIIRSSTHLISDAATHVFFFFITMIMMNWKNFFAFGFGVIQMDILHRVLA